MNNAIFQDTFRSFEQHHKEMIKRADLIQDEIRKNRFLKNEELNNIRKQVEGLESSNTKDLRTLKRMMNLVANNMQTRFMKGHF